MKPNNFLIHPYIRLLVLVCVLLATFLLKSIFIVGIFYLAILIPLLIINKQIKSHLKFLLVGILPIALSLVLINIIVLQGKSGSWDFILIKILKLTISATIFQFILLIPSSDLYHTLKKWGFRGDALITLISSFTVWNEIGSRSEKIVTARLARGYVKTRSFFNMSKQLPFVLNPLFIGVLRTSIERAESWGQKDISRLVESYNTIEPAYPVTYNTIVSILSLAYFFIGLFYSNFF